MPTQEQRIISAFQAVGTDIKEARTRQGDLTALNTTARSSLVAAINEVRALAMAGGGGGEGGGAPIDDAAGDGDTAVTWSANKIHDEIVARVNALGLQLTAGASAALDTFAELAAAMGNDPSFATTIATGLSNRVRFDASQTLSGAQATQARNNIAAASAAALTALVDAIGNPDADFVAVYNAAKA